VSSTGCLACVPLSYGCDGTTLLRCSADGSGYEPSEQCGEGLFCSPLGCLDLCAQAERERSYIGCEYYPVFTINNQLDAKFKPAVVIANPNLVVADVLISRGTEQVERVQVAPGAVQTIMLEYSDALRVPLGSAIVRNGAYHLVSSVPVTVHQFNPLLFEIDEDCARDESGEEPGEPNDNKCNSYSNDASLLLPVHSLKRAPGEAISYLATARASFSASNKPEGPYVFPSPGFITIVAAGDRPVHVKVSSSAYTLASAGYLNPDATVFDPGSDAGPASDDAALAEDAGVEQDAARDVDAGLADDAGRSDDGSLAEDAAALDVDVAPAPSDPDALPPLSPGESLTTLTLMPGDVLQLLSYTPRDCSSFQPVPTRREFVCPLGAEYDLTGTAIEADGPIEVIAGHNCSYVPLGRLACDHLEETMFPLDTWGLEAIAPRPKADILLPQVVRVLSGADDNGVTFTPAVHEPVTLARGEMLEFLTNEHVLISAQKPISVAQYLVGQNGQGTVGDPSMSIAIPVEQYRSSYAFLSPATYVRNYVTVMAQAGDTIVLDGREVGGFVDVAGGAYQVAGVELLQSGAHEVHSALGLGVGLLVYGYGDYTSYMLPGGLDLRPINILF